MNERSFRLKLYASFAVVYVAWGSTFLAIRIGVQDLPPLLFAGARAAVGGLLLLALALHRREAMPATPREWLYTVLFGIAMITFSSGATTFSLQYLPSNEVALLNASLALWLAGLGTLGPKGQPLRARSIAGLLLGFVGVALLVWRDGLQLDRHLGWQLLTIGGCLVWAAATIVYRNVSMSNSPMSFNSLMLLSGAACLLIVGTAAGELPRWQWRPAGIWTLLYLGVVGSALTYTAYAWLLKNVRTDRVATFAYVNPAIATLLGWAVLGERLAPNQLLGMAVILGGVVLVTMPSRIG